ncbi:MAG: radical SAM protein [Chloroflexi bacterium]|nr:radical SAM protein [Chloroflexota bacterium]
MPIQTRTGPDARPLIVNVRRESIILMEGADREYTFDRAGRLVGVFRDGRRYRRSLQNTVLAKQAGPRRGVSARLRRMLAAAEVQALVDEAYGFARGAAARLDDAPQTRDALARVAGYDYARLERERADFDRLYRPITILPPDQYLALYLQATEGCSYNDCAFCGFYQDRRFHVKSLDEFRAHVRDVRAFFGDGLSLRRSLFLGDANALVIPQREIVPLFDQLNADLAILPRDLAAPARAARQFANPVHFHGIYSFIDAFSTKRKSAQDYAELAGRGLRRVYVGLETGDAELLRFLGKPNTPGEVIHLVESLKAGGVAAGVIVLAGAGGATYDERHVRETARIVNAMPLDRHDLIYLSELVDYPGSTYSMRARAAGLAPLPQPAIEQQMFHLRESFVFRDPANAPRVSYYDIREFVY